MLSRQNQIPISRCFSLTIPASEPNKKKKSGNPAPARYQNFRFPLPFLACIPDITTNNSQILHPAKPIVDPQV